LRQGAERSQNICEELGRAAQDLEIKEVLDAREFSSTQIRSRLDECFRLIGEKPMKRNGRLHEVFLEDFRKELKEIQPPPARRSFILGKASRLMHLRIGEYTADKLAFADRTKLLIREQLKEERVAA